MIKKHFLGQSDDQDFQVIGLVSTMKDYRLAYFINRSLGFGLKRGEKLYIPHPKEAGEIGFSMYYWDNPTGERSQYLLANKCREGMLVGGLKEADYFLLTRGALAGSRQDALLKSLRGLSGIIMAYSIPAKSRPLLYPMLAELELHLVKGLDKQGLTP